MTSASDDGAVIKCRASHPALVTAAIYPHLEDSVNLTIYCKNTFSVDYQITLECLINVPVR